jgi:hypothetical protein
MVNVGKAVSKYISTDGDLCVLFINKFIKLSDLCPELPVAVCHAGKTGMLEILELK